MSPPLHGRACGGEGCRTPRPNSEDFGNLLKKKCQRIAKVHVRNSQKTILTWNLPTAARPKSIFIWDIHMRAHTCISGTNKSRNLLVQFYVFRFGDFRNGVTLTWVHGASAETVTRRISITLLPTCLDWQCSESSQGEDILIFYYPWGSGWVSVWQRKAVFLRKCGHFLLVQKFIYLKFGAMCSCFSRVCNQRSE